MNSSLAKRIVFIVMLVIQYNTSWSQELPPPFVITNDTTLEYIFTPAQYQMLPDKTGKLTLEKLQHGAYGKQFFTKNRTPFEVDTLSNTTWYRYTIKNNLQKEFSISLYTRAEHSDFYLIRTEQNPVHYQNGWDIPWKDRDGLPEDNIIPLMLTANEQVIIYNKVYNRRPGAQPNFKVKLLNTNKYALKRISERQGYYNLSSVMFVMFAGFCLLGALFNFFLYMIERQKVYLYFSLFLFSLVFVIGPTWSIGVLRYYPSTFPFLNLFTGSAITIFFIQFIRFYFQTFISAPKWDRLLIGLILVQCLPLLQLFNIISDFTVNLIIDATIVISCIGTLVIFVRLRHKNAKSFAIAILPFPIAMVGNLLVSFLKGQGFVLSENVISISEFALIIPIGWPVIFFTWALFKQYDWQKKEIIQHALNNERLQKEKEIERNALIEQQKIELEKTVHERTAELRQSIKDLQVTQAQLIQSEKMASLGELTAGIAHEIQNPLNFVNNFSEVSREMLEELKTERLKPNAERDEQLTDEIINDVIANEEKINHHGKRADAIVKGMLQHSRSSSGVKELTDINALCDEYLRLSYHGLRAKDKSFNATMKTDFDNSIGNINIIQQDIGRVILNLLTNAFYVVDEKKKSGVQVYEPTVSVNTKRINDKIEIRVSDNGNGIPAKVMDKIFQPFFTTKPTGQGTGLGLSLSYDIVTKGHGGELKVETKENEGSTFTIILPQS